MRITVDMVMKLGPCYDRDYIEELFGGREYVYPKTVLADERLTAADKIWLLARPEFLGKRNTMLLGADYAEHVLPIWENKYPDDSRLRDCIQTVRRYAVGEATEDELINARATARVAKRDAIDAAWNTAQSAVWDAVWYAARAEVWYAAWYAAQAVAWEAAWYAVRDVEREWQLKRLAYWLQQEDK